MPRSLDIRVHAQIINCPVVSLHNVSFSLSFNNRSQYAIILIPQLTTNKDDHKSVFTTTGTTPPIFPHYRHQFKQLNSERTSMLLVVFLISFKAKSLLLFWK